MHCLFKTRKHLTTCFLPAEYFDCFFLFVWTSHAPLHSHTLFYHTAYILIFRMWKHVHYVTVGLRCLLFHVELEHTVNCLLCQARWALNVFWKSSDGQWNDFLLLCSAGRAQRQKAALLLMMLTSVHLFSDCWRDTFTHILVFVFSLNAYWC